MMTGQTNTDRASAPIRRRPPWIDESLYPFDSRYIDLGWEMDVNE